jgi:phage/plasmid-like protein (TIGR03299 family)
MPANVETMMYVGDRPWHGLGTRVENTISSAEAIKAAGLDWDADLIPLQIPAWTTSAGFQIEPRIVDEVRVVVRATDGKILGRVGPGYTVIQNREGFAAFDPFVKEGFLKYHTAGSLGSGQRVWILCELPGEMVLPGDISKIRKFLLLANAHDGSMALRVMPTPIRVVCQNTLSAALADEVASFTVRHTASAPDRIKDAVEAFKATLLYYDRFQAEAERLQVARYSLEQMRALTNHLMPLPREEEAKPKLLRAHETLVGLFETQRGAAGIEGTAWGAVNAVAEYADHVRTVRDGEDGVGGARMKAALFGPAAVLKSRAYQYVRRQIAA